jgi:phosphohistidine swiveling domain-containing protein
MIDPNKEIFKWGPIDGRPIYMDPFVRAFAAFPKFYEGTWPDTIGYFENDKGMFILDDKSLRDNGEELFKKYNLDENKIKEAYSKWLKLTEKIKEFESKVNQGLSSLSNEDLKKIFCDFDKIHVDFWIHGYIPELGNYGGEQLLKRKILEFDKINFIEVFEVISAPEDISFFQKEELELMQLKLDPDEKKLKQHQQKYYWLRNSYCFTKVLNLDFFRKELENISVEQAKAKIKEINNHVASIRKKKEEIIKRYRIPKEIVKISNKLAYCVWWQDLRKKFIFISNHIMSVFVEEISKRKNVGFKELCYYSVPELVDLLDKNKRVNGKVRFNGYIEYYHERKGISYLEGKKAKDFATPYIEVKVDKNKKEFSGLVVSKGHIVKAKVKILLSPKEMNKMDKGDILVAPMTSPDFIVAMRKASAIITDEGGMTCHAAIVSRELKIPCIVNTRIATKLLKDDDIVEVDTKKGIIKIIKRV